MKRLINLFIIVSLALFASCTSEVDDIFDDSSANRMDARLKANQEVLIGAKNGWLMEYYPAPGMVYGGFNVLVSFAEDSKVTVAADISDAGGTAVSTYRLKDSSGPILTFDTYNSIFHFFSDPKNSAGIGSTGKGMEGDYEFLIMEATPEKVVLRGKKTGNKIVMTPLKEEVKWSEYLEPVIKMNDILSRFNKYKYAEGDFVADVVSSYNSLVLSYVANGNSQTVTAPYIVTDFGFRFYTPLMLNGKSITALKYQPNSEDGVLVPVDGGEAIMQPVFPLNGLFAEGEWYFSYKGMGSNAAKYWNFVKQNVLDPNKMNLNYALFTPITATSLAFYWSAGDFPDGYLIFNHTLIGDDEIAIKFALSGNAVGVTFYNELSWNRMIYPFSAGTTGKVFKLTADDPKRPTVVTMTDKSDPLNTMMLYKAEVLDPFDN